MAGVINKRQQVRNERALQELIKTVPGNDKCAECGAKNPGACDLPRADHSLPAVMRRSSGRWDMNLFDWTLTC